MFLQLFTTFYKAFYRSLHKDQKGFVPLIILVAVALMGLVSVGVGTLVEKTYQGSPRVAFDIEKEIREAPQFLDKFKIRGGKIEGDLVGTVILPDGSFSAYKLIEGQVAKVANSSTTRYIGETKIEFLSGDFAIGNFNENKINQFVLKDGSRVEAIIAGRLIAKLVLKNGQIVPLKILEGEVKSGRLAGDFQAQTFTSGHLIGGKLDNDGQITQAAVVSGADKATEAQTIIAKKALTLFKKIAQNSTLLVTSRDYVQQSSSVLGVENVDLMDLDEGPSPVFDPKKGVWTFGGETVAPSTSQIANIANFFQQTITSTIASQVETKITEKVTEGITVIPEVGIKEIKSDSARLKVATDNDVSTLKLDLAGITADISNDSVKTEHIKDGEVKEGDIASGAVNAGKLASTLTFDNGDFLDLSRITHSSTSQMGLLLPNTSSASPSNPSTGEGYLAYDTSGNQVIVYTGSSWTQVGSGDITGVTAGSGLTGGGSSGAVTLAVDTAASLTWTAAQTFSGNVGVEGLLTLSDTGITGGGLASCSGSSAKLLWNSSTNQFSCGTDLNTGGSGGAGGWVDYATAVGLSTQTANVGIGTSPSIANAKVEIQGNGNSTGLAFLTHNLANSVFGLTVLDNGNVGIGTTSSDYNLKVIGTGYFSTFLGVGTSLNVSGNVGIGQSLTVSSGTTLSAGLAVTGGSVVLPSGSINNSELENSAITVSATAGTGLSVTGSPVSLGGTLTLAGIDASTTVKGVASFNSTNFSVSSGAVNTIQDISTSSSPTFSALTLSGNNAALSLTGSTPSLTSNTSLSIFPQAGNVGIGTSSPLYGALTVKGLGTGTGIALQTYSGSSLTQGLTVLDNGNVGIGTTNPGAKLHIADTTDAEIRMTAASSWPLILKQDINSNFSINNDNVDRFYIKAGGNVGIGTTTPLSLLAVAGGAHIGSTRQGISAPTDGLFVDGNVGIGATTSDNKLDVWGNARVTGSLTLDGALTTQSTVTFNSLSLSSGTGLCINGSNQLITCTGGSESTTASNGLNLSGVDVRLGGMLTLPTGLDINSQSFGFLRGNVGVGTTSSDYNFKVIGTGYFSDFLGVGTSLNVSGNAGIGGSINLASNSVIKAAGNASIVFANSSSFVIADDAGNTLVVYNDTTNAFTIGNATNGFTFDIDTGPAYAGSARPVKTIVLSPEYAGATLTAFNGSATDTNITGNMIADVETTAANSLRTYYQWERTTDTTQHFYTVAVRVTLPSDFSVWQTTNALQVEYVTENATNTVSDLDVRVYLESDSTTAVASSVDNASTSWTTVTIDDSTLDDAGAPEWDAAGETAVIYLRMGSSVSGTGQYVRVGDIFLNYLAAF